MQVLYLINFAGKAGTEKYVENLIRAYHPTRCGCSLCYNVDGPLAEKTRQMGIPTYQLTMRHPFDCSAAKALAKLCREQEIDVVHTQYPRENYIAILSKAFGNPAKIVFTAHLTLEQPLPWKLLNRIMTRWNHRVIAVCRAGADIQAKNGVREDRISVVYNGIDPGQMPPRDRSFLSQFQIQDELVLSTLARLSPEKGLDFLCRSIALLKRKTAVPFRVLIAGDGEQMEEIRQLIAQEGLEDTILLLGFRSDTPALLAASDIYLNTSQHEAMSLSILEAMACRLPVVATDVGGNPDLVTLEEPSGFVVPYGDTEAFSDRLCQLLEDGTLRTRLGDAAYKKTCGTFSLEQSVEKLFQIYQS